MATEKTPNYSPAQEKLIVEAIAANDGVANKAVAETLANDPRMNGEDGPRKVRSIIAKMRRVVETREDFSYERVQPATKDGKPVTKKTDLVARIAALSGATASKLDGLDKAPKLALDTLVEALAA